MTSMGNQEVFSADVLVIGGGAAGAFAAIKARESGATNVVLVEKAMTGKSGASCFAAGVLTAFIPEEDDVDLWMKELVEHGQYLNDQDWLHIYLEETFSRVKELEAWGCLIRKAPNGKYERVRGRGSHPDKGLRNVMFTGQEGDLTNVLRKKLRASGTTIIDWTMVTDLLTKDGRVVGAVGFHTRHGNFRLFKSKSTVLALGGGSLRSGINIGHRMNNHEATGMAYRAGVELINCDFAQHFPFCGEFKIGGMNMTVGLGGRLANVLGERFMIDYDPVYRENAVRYILGNAPLLETKGGRGPIYMDLTDLSPEAVEVFRSVLPLNATILERAGVLVGNRILRKLEWSMSGPSFSGGIRINTECETSLPGLYAAGDAAAKMPSGTTDSAGALPFAFVSGARAGKFAAEYAKGAPEPELDEAQLKDSKERLLAPLGRGDGVEGDYVIEALQEIVIPYGVLMLRHGERMKQALAEVIKLKEELLPLLYAHDLHYLRLAHEACGLLFMSEIVLRAGLERKESRAHIREDYPYVDNVNWLKWLLLKRDEQGMRIWTEDVPIDRYPVRPKRERFIHPCLEVAQKRGIVRDVGEGGVQWA